jgi:hypothetical protein
MNASLMSSLRSYVGFVAAAMLPVVLVAFCSIPVSLGRHPGEPAPGSSMPLPRHVT